MVAENSYVTRPGLVRLGISSCLLGEEVRYNGGHVKDDFLVNTLGQYVQWVPVCPEVEMGMGVPRENVRLVGDAEDPRLVAPKSGTDHTDTMKKWAGQRLLELEGMDLHGYILKKIPLVADSSGLRFTEVSRRLHETGVDCLPGNWLTNSQCYL